MQINKSVAQTESKEKEVIIIGAGIAGITVSIGLAKAGYKITIIERSDRVLKGISDRTARRLGAGCHYLGETSKVYLGYVALAVRLWPQLGECRIEGSRWHYFIHKDSRFKKDEILSNFEALREYYEQLVKENPENVIFGDPQTFYQEISKDDFIQKYPKHPFAIMGDKITGIIEVAEGIFDWPKIRELLIKEVEGHPNIKVITNTEVVSMEEKNGEIKLNLKPTDRKKTPWFCKFGIFNIHDVVSAPTVVNAAWEQANSLNKTLRKSLMKSHNDPLSSFNRHVDRTIIKRIKPIAEVQLPEGWEGILSAMVAYGPYISYSLIGEGRALLTSEKANIIVESEELSSEHQEWIRGNISKQDKLFYFNKILEGFRAFLLPELAEFNPTLIEIKFGIVLTESADFNERLEKGVELTYTGPGSTVMTVMAWKFWQAWKNSEEAVQLLTLHQSMRDTLKDPDKYNFSILFGILGENFKSSIPRGSQIQSFIMGEIAKQFSSHIAVMNELKECRKIRITVS